MPEGRERNSEMSSGPWPRHPSGREAPAEKTVGEKPKRAAWRGRRMATEERARQEGRSSRPGGPAGWGLKRPEGEGVKQREGGP